VGEAQAARRLTVGGALAEVAIAQTMERRLSSEGVGEAYHEGATKHLNHAASVLTIAGAAVVAAAGRRSRAAAVAGGLLVSAGALAERWTVFRAGHRSAERPQDTVAPQRARISRGETRGAARREPRLAARAPAAAHDGLAMEPPGTTDGAPGGRPVTPGSPAIPPKT
jgi:hypothetical protein